MKKCCVLLAALLLVSLCAGCVVQTGQENWVEGICFVADNGRVLLIADDESIALTDRSKDGGLLEGLRTGDRIRVLCDGIAESYPAQAGIYRLEKLGQGSVDDIPSQVLDSLRQLGWID